MKKLWLTAAAFLIAITLASTGRASARPLTSTGGDNDADVIDVTGGAVTGITTQGLTLGPTFSPSDTDYVWYCGAGTNNVTLQLTGNRPLIVDGQNGMQVSLKVSVVPNQAVVINSPDDQYWIRCLPPTFPEMTVSGNGSASPGYYVTGAFRHDKGPGYPMILNSYGTPVWYAALPNDASENTEVLPGTHTVSWAANPTYTLFNMDSDSESTLTPPVPSFDEHELYTDRTGDHWVISVPLKGGYNLSDIGFPQDHYIKNCVVQELSPAGRLLWKWDASRYVSPSETDGLDGKSIDEGKTAIDVYHCNSVDVDPVNSNHVLISMRHVGVFLVNKKTGKPIWKLGGTSAPTMSGEPSLTIVDDPESGIRGQHDARFEPGGDISLFDDHTRMPGAARGIEFRVDTHAGTATMVWEYVAPSSHHVNAMGSVRRYDSGLHTYDQAGAAYGGPDETIINWGDGAPTPGFTELGPSNDVELNVAFPDNDGYRTEKLSLSALNLNELRDLAGTTLPAPSSS